MELGIPPGFLVVLLKSDDDWSFVVKLHAFFEGALAHCLAEEIGRPELAAVLAHTELSRPRAGKIEFGKAMGLLSKRERRFLRSLSELRHELVHDVKRTSFTFSDHLDAMGAKQQRAFYEKFEIDVVDDHIEIKGKHVSRVDFFLANPKLMIWMASVVMLEHLYVHKELIKVTRDLNAQYAEIYRWLKDPVPPPKT